MPRARISRRIVFIALPSNCNTYDIKMNLLVLYKLNSVKIFPNNLHFLAVLCIHIHYTLSLDPDPIFRPNLDPDTDPGSDPDPVLCY